MKNSVNRRISFVCLVSLVFAASAQAGPPLICHSIEIGQAQSLPWISEGWNLSGAEKYDLKNLVRDTLAILNPSTPVLVRMETLRRASLYARKDPQAAKELLARLIARTSAGETAGHPDALAFFDAGYLAETHKQSFGKDSQNPATGIDGYLQVKRAIELRGEDPQMEFAAAMITVSGRKNEHREHVVRATAGAKRDPLLAQNLASHFSGHTGETIAEMFAKTATPNK